MQILTLSLIIFLAISRLRFSLGLLSMEQKKMFMSRQFLSVIKFFPGPGLISYPDLAFYKEGINGSQVGFPAQVGRNKFPRFCFL